MFESATLKLTAWYLLIIMVISLLFSILIYQSAAGEVGARLEQFKSQIPPSAISTGIYDFQVLQAREAAHHIFMNLVYVNILVLVAGGVASYLMARRTLEPLQQAHEAESRFVSDASHELRTPLAAMKTELEVALRDAELPPEEMRELLQSNLEEVDKLTKLSETLLNMSRMRHDRLTHEQVSLRDVVTDAVTMYDKTGERIKLKLGSKELSVDAHRPSIEELCAILIDNALKYSPSDSAISITLKRRSNKAMLAIANSGPGIPANDLPHIFERFYRADNARTGNKSASFGLGLSLAKQIVELHNGELTVTSAPNKLTTFTVLLPLIRDKQNGKLPHISQ